MIDPEKDDISSGVEGNRINNSDNASRDGGDGGTDSASPRSPFQSHDFKQVTAVTASTTTTSTVLSSPFTNPLNLDDIMRRRFLATTEAAVAAAAAADNASKVQKDSAETKTPKHTALKLSPENKLPFSSHDIYSNSRPLSLSSRSPSTLQQKSVSNPMADIIKSDEKQRHDPTDSGTDFIAPSARRLLSRGAGNASGGGSDGTHPQGFDEDDKVNDSGLLPFLPPPPSFLDESQSIHSHSGATGATGNDRGTLPWNPEQGYSDRNERQHSIIDDTDSLPAVPVLMSGISQNYTSNSQYSSVKTEEQQNQYYNAEPSNDKFEHANYFDNDYTAVVDSSAITAEKMPGISMSPPSSGNNTRGVENRAGEDSVGFNRRTSIDYSNDRDQSENGSISNRFRSLQSAQRDDDNGRFSYNNSQYRTSLARGIGTFNSSLRGEANGIGSGASGVSGNNREFSSPSKNPPPPPQSSYVSARDRRDFREEDSRFRTSTSTPNNNNKGGDGSININDQSNKLDRVSMASLGDGRSVTSARSRSPPAFRRKRDDEISLEGNPSSSKRNKTDDQEYRRPASTQRLADTRSTPIRSKESEAVSEIIRLCEYPEKLERALEQTRVFIQDRTGSATFSDQTAAARKVMITASRARRVRITQDAYELLSGLRGGSNNGNGTVSGLDELGTSDFVELLSLYVATGKKDLLADVLGRMKVVLSVSNVAVVWQTALVGPRKSAGVISILTRYLIGVMEKVSLGSGNTSAGGSNEFFGVVVLELVATGLTDLLEKFLAKLNVGNVPSRANYTGTMAPRSSIPLKRGVLIAAVDYYVGIKKVLAAFECLKYMYDVGYGFNEESVFSVFKLALAGNIDTGGSNEYIDEVFKMVKSISGLYLSNPNLFDEALTVACESGNVEFAIDLVEHMAQTKTRPSSWFSILPVMRLASSWNLLQKFVGVFNLFFTSGDEGEGNAPHSDMDPTLISELVTNCVAHGMYTHGFWYFKYMSHAGIPRTHEAYRSLLFALDMDMRGLKLESVGLWTDINLNQYPITAEQLTMLFKALLSHGGLDAKKAALEIYDTRTTNERKSLVSSVNPNILLDFIFYFDRDSEGFAVFEELCEADVSWPQTLSDNATMLLFQKAGDHGRFDILQLAIERLRASSQMIPNRQLIRNMLGSLSLLRSNDPARITLATIIYIWGVKANTSGYIKTKELFNLNIRLDECWCLLDIRLHLLRCLEWMHREIAKNLINTDIKVYLPQVCSVLNNNPSGNAVVKLKGPVLANCVKAEIRSWFSNKIDVRMETDDRERDRDGSRVYLVFTFKSVLEWMNYIFDGAGGFETDSVFNAISEIRDKSFEGGTLIFAKENQDVLRKGAGSGRINDSRAGNNRFPDTQRDRNSNNSNHDSYKSGNRGASERYAGNNTGIPARHFKREEYARRDTGGGGRRDDYRSNLYESRDIQQQKPQQNDDSVIDVPQIRQYDNLYENRDDANNGSIGDYRRQ
ncbi:hypothetical protein HK100_011297 [Physocladia obscura]|uniref:Uncharacterized protein n=1 Tax=Physocladia obscura TaxID=109957 RepID=A0AAD5T2V6_9FUNG|nr:hypothetical protein HK100_011297 [Physocladia obscura]